MLSSTRSVHHLQGTQARRYKEHELVALHQCVSVVPLLCRHKHVGKKMGNARSKAGKNGKAHTVLEGKKSPSSGTGKARTGIGICSKCSVGMRCIPGQVRAGQTAVSALGSHSPACVTGGGPERSQHASPSSERRAALVDAHEGAASHSLRKGADNRHRGPPRPVLQRFHLSSRT